MIRIVFCTLALFPSFSFAESTSTDCPSTAFINIQIRNNSDYPKISCENIVAPIEDAMKTLNSISPVDLSGIYLIIYNQALLKGAKFAWVTSTLYLDIDDVKDINDDIVVFYHEMGHKIYFEYMAKIVPEIIERKPKLDAYVEHMITCSVSVPLLPEECKTSSGHDAIMKTFYSFTNDFNNFLYITTPYNELFADVVASLAANNQNAIADVMEECTEMDYACEYRAFSKNTYDKFAGENPYARFSPIRRDLWDSWIVPRQNDPKALLEELATFLVKDSYSNYTADYALIEGMASLVQTKRVTAALGLKKTESPTINYKR